MFKFIQSYYNSYGAWECVKMLFALICIGVCIGQVVEGIKMIKSNNNAPSLPVLEMRDMETVGNGVEFKLKVDNVITKIEGDTTLNGAEVEYFIASTHSQKLIVLRAITGSSACNQLHEFENGRTEPLYLRGVSKEMRDANHGAFNLQIIAGRIIEKSDITETRSIRKALLPKVVDVTVAEALINPKIIVFTFVGAGLMLLFAFLLLRKAIGLAIQSVKARKGTLEYTPKVKLEDLIFEDTQYYQGNEDHGEYFFVNTEYNIYDAETRAKITGEELPEDSTTKPPVSSEEEGYVSKVNSEGNFYVGDEPEKPDSRPYRRRY